MCENGGEARKNARGKVSLCTRALTSRQDTTEPPTRLLEPARQRPKVQPETQPQRPMQPELGPGYFRFHHQFGRECHFEDRREKAAFSWRHHGGNPSRTGFLHATQECGTDRSSSLTQRPRLELYSGRVVAVGRRFRATKITAQNQNTAQNCSGYSASNNTKTDLEVAGY